MDYYNSLDRIIREEIEKGQQIAIYPFGKFGMQANEILKQRYGRTAILIDNNLVKYNPDIITIDEFLDKKSINISIILCASNREVSEALHKDLIIKQCTNPIRNMLEAPIEYVPENEEYFKKIKELCCVKHVSKYPLVRVGGEYDGGYVMLDDFDKEGVVAYSFGIGNDISWDEQAANKGMEVFCYDPTVWGLPKRNDRLQFERIGITGKDIPDDNLYSMRTIMEKNGHINKTDMILKMDVEGAEWDFFEETPSEVLAQFRQMTFELHDMTDIRNADKVLNCLTKLRKTHEPVWIHANNNGGLVVAGDYAIPKLLEITYVNKKSYDFSNNKYDCPLEIDTPNVNCFLEIELKGWGEKDE